MLMAGGCGAGGGTLVGAGGNTGGGAGAATGTPANPLGIGAQSGTGTGTGTGATGSVGGASGFSGMSCGAVAQPLSLLVPYVVIALDASASMNTDMTNTTCDGGCGPSSKWAATVAAINQTISETAGRVNWGVELFGMDRPAVCGTVESWIGSLIETGLSNITTADGNVLGGTGRPTRQAIVGAASYLSSIGVSNPKVVVLVSDGVPGCAAGVASTDDTGPTVEAIATAAAGGMPTSVIGIATAGGPASDSLVMMGMAGLIGSPAGSSVGYSPVSTADAIRQSLAAVADTVVGCGFALPKAPTSDGTTTTSSIGVIVNGLEIPRGTPDGWDYTDRTRTGIRLFGDACAAAKAAAPPAVSITFKCILI
jgi:hypothetical protein